MPKKKKEGRTYCDADGPFTVGELDVEALPVSHSLEGATAYILETSSGPVLYTGDFRFHGYKGNETRRFVERAAEVEPVAMICEGTRINSTKQTVKSE